MNFCLARFNYNLLWLGIIMICSIFFTSFESISTSQFNAYANVLQE